MKRFSLLPFFFFIIMMSVSGGQLVAMDLDQEKPIDVQQCLQPFWQQIELQLHKAVAAKNFDIIIHIFNRCFKKNSLFVCYKQDACEIVAGFVRKKLEEKYIIGLYSGYEALQIIQLIGLDQNKEFLNHWQGIEAGVFWLHTGEVSDKLDKEKIVNDWERIIHAYLTHAFEQGDEKMVQRIWRANYKYQHSPIFEPHLLTLSDFILQNMPNKLAHLPKPILKDAQSVNTVQQHGTQEGQVNTKNHINQPTGFVHWIQEHPVITFTGIAAVCAGIYSYFKKDKQQQDKPKQRDE